MLLTGDLINGNEAVRTGLITAAYPAATLDQEVDKWAQR